MNCSSQTPLRPGASATDMYDEVFDLKSTHQQLRVCLMALNLLGMFAASQFGYVETPLLATTLRYNNARLNLLSCRANLRRPVHDLAAVVAAKCLVRRWDVSQRLAQAAENAERQARNEAARAEGRPQELVYSKLYLPEQGMFADMPADLALGTKQQVSWLPHWTPPT